MKRCDRMERMGVMGKGVNTGLHSLKYRRVFHPGEWEHSKGKRRRKGVWFPAPTCRLG